MWSVVAALAVALVVAHPAAVHADFTHPGVFVDAARLDHIRKQVLAVKSGSIYDAYNKALVSKYTKHTMTGPPKSGVIECGSYSHPNHGCSAEDSDVVSAYLNALLWAINGEEAHEDKAIAVLNAYSHGLKEYNNSNAPLQAGWAGMMYTKAAELLAFGRGANASRWAEADQKALKRMLTTITLPLIHEGSGANGNWELTMLDAMLGIAVLTEDEGLFAHAVEMWRQRLPAYFYLSEVDGDKPVPPPRGHPSWYKQEVFNASVDGHCQETCRDLGHMQFGLASAVNAAATAEIQGVDLFGEQHSAGRLTKAMEYHAGFLLGNPVPAYVCPAETGVGKLGSAPTFEVAFDAYARQKNYSLPLTAQHIQEQVRTMTDPAGGHIFVYETLTHGGPL